MQYPRIKCPVCGVNIPPKAMKRKAILGVLGAGALYVYNLDVEYKRRRKIKYSRRARKV